MSLTGSRHGHSGKFGDILCSGDLVLTVLPGQPFLRPIPPTGSEALLIATSPLRYAIGLVRTLLVLILGILHALIVEVVCQVLVSKTALAVAGHHSQEQRSVPPLHRVVSHVFTALFARLALLFIGLPWIPVQVVSRKRGYAYHPRASECLILTSPRRRNSKTNETWSPGAGDLIVSNWVSTIEILWLAFRYTAFACSFRRYSFPSLGSILSLCYP